jgi:hypothetical protein
LISWRLAVGSKANCQLPTANYFRGDFMAQSKTLYTVLNPLGRPTHTTKPAPLAPRLSEIDGKTVYLVDVGFGGSYEFFEEMKGWFSRRIPSVKAEVMRKPGNMFTDEADFWAELKRRCDAVIFGVGG